MNQSFKIKKFLKEATKPLFVAGLIRFGTLAPNSSASEVNPNHLNSEYVIENVQNVPVLSEYETSNDTIQPSFCIKTGSDSVILVRSEGPSGPANVGGLPGAHGFNTPPSHQRPGPAPKPNKAPHAPHVNRFRSPAKHVDPALGARRRNRGGNPAGGGAGNPGGNPGGFPNVGDYKSENMCPAPEKNSTPNYDPRREFSKKKKQDQCSINENPNRKAGIDELPESSKYVYKLKTKSVRKEIHRIWNNPKNRKEVLAGLKRIDSGELLPRHQKPFKGFKDIKEIKLNETRMLVYTGGEVDEIVAIVNRNKLDDIAKVLKTKFK